MRTLGTLAARIDELFHHRVTRQVRRDGTVSYQGRRFEVAYALSGKQITLVVDPHTRQVLGVEDDNGQSLGAATPLDAVANVQRKRRKPQPSPVTSSSRTGDDENFPVELHGSRVCSGFEKLEYVPAAILGARIRGTVSKSPQRASSHRR